MRGLAVGLAVVGSLTMSFFAIRAITITIPRFSDPCFHWGSDSATRSGNVRTYSLSAVISQGDPCASGRGATSETKAQAVARLLIVSGGILVAAALGIIGTVRRKPAITISGALLMFLEALPLVFSLAPVAVLTGGAFLAVGLRQLRFGSRQPLPKKWLGLV